MCIFRSRLKEKRMHTAPIQNTKTSSTTITANKILCLIITASVISSSLSVNIKESVSAAAREDLRLLEARELCPLFGYQTLLKEKFAAEQPSGVE
mmetsp:Transcript_4245/g.7732  ORF Transcript_4245/g.7732 Transcript_4245/m.7732 type:complete len:95 (+) Transcript_4245:138-422(+)